RMIIPHQRLVSLSLLTPPFVRQESAPVSQRGDTNTGCCPRPPQSCAGQRESKQPSCPRIAARFHGRRSIGLPQPGQWPGGDSSWLETCTGSSPPSNRPLSHAHDIIQGVALPVSPVCL